MNGRPTVLATIFLILSGPIFTHCASMAAFIPSTDLPKGGSPGPKDADHLLTVVPLKADSASIQDDV